MYSSNNSHFQWLRIVTYFVCINESRYTVTGAHLNYSNPFASVLCKGQIEHVSFLIVFPCVPQTCSNFNRSREANGCMSYNWLLKMLYIRSLPLSRVSIFPEVNLKNVSRVLDSPLPPGLKWSTFLLFPLSKFNFIPYLFWWLSRSETMQCHSNVSEWLILYLGTISYDLPTILRAAFVGTNVSGASSELSDFNHKQWQRTLFDW